MARTVIAHLFSSVNGVSESPNEWQFDAFGPEEGEMLGTTSGLKAAPGTIRGDFSSSRQMNLVHGSDGPEAAAREIALYFRDDEICANEPTISKWLRASDEA